LNTVITKTRYTPDDLLTMPEGDHYELVDGQLVERNMGFRSGRVAAELVWLLASHCKKYALGWVLPSDVGYQCFPDDPEQVRKPDVSFLRKERLPADQEPEGHCRVAPDLVVEVVSPNDLFEEVTGKVEEYLSAGVLLVWVVDPARRRVSVYRRDGTGTVLRPDDELTGEDALAGFRCRVGDLFVPPPGTLPSS
jgi:Uma2 family endonuclease